MRKMTMCLVAALGIVGAASSAFADVQLSMQNGRVTIIAKDATLRQILMEWARVGQTKIVNVERIPGGPLTLELRDVPEEQALRVLLRPISGYLTAPRATVVSGAASVFDRIIVMPTLAAASTPLSAAAPPPPSPAPTFFPPPGAVPEQAEDQQQQQPGGAAAPAASPFNRGPVFVFPQPVTTTPPAQGVGGAVQGGATGAPVPPPPAPTQPASVFPTGAPTTNSPTGVAVPGMIVPAPTQQPGQVTPPAPPSPTPQ